MGASYGLRTSAVDPSGEWWNDMLVAKATEQYRRRQATANQGTPTREQYDAIRRNAWRYERAEQWRNTGIDPGLEPTFDWLEAYNP